MHSSKEKASKPFELCVQGLSQVYQGRKVISNVSFSVKQGQVVGLLGPNGAGKTTSFYAATGLIYPDQGKVFLNGQEVTHLPMHERARMGLAYLPQEVSVFRKLTVEENILMVLELRSLSDREQNQKLEQLLDDFHLSTLRYQKAYTLSGGERRRVEVARALAMDPHFLLLDEPFAGIDPIAVEEIQNMLLVLKKKQIGILVTDHNVRETLQICDFSYVLANGKILESGPPSKIAQSKRARSIYLGEHFDFPSKRGVKPHHGS